MHDTHAWATYDHTFSQLMHFVERSSKYTMNKLRSMNLPLFFTLLVLLIASFEKTYSQRSFTIDYVNDQFLKDGKPFRYISGSLHYFRVPREHWEDRLLKMKAVGLNAIQTYVDWSQHEPEPGMYNFDGMLDIQGFLELVASWNLLVILRPGPYICAERDMGGLPYWLLRDDPQMSPRSSDPAYLKHVDKWMAVLFEIIQPYLYENGGPIITVQVENEYGSYYTCDFDYTTHLRELFRKHLGDEMLLFTTDGTSDGNLKCGKIQNTFATIDFEAGRNVSRAIQIQRNHQPDGPFVNSEFYTGWLDHWGYPHAQADIVNIGKTLREILIANGSVNMYMFHGGTNFGFTNGANMASGGEYQPQLTSYDYDSPLSEAGDPNSLYYRIRDIISEFADLSELTVPTPTPKCAYGRVEMHPVGSLFDLLTVLGPNSPVRSKFPLTFEKLRQAYGFVLYETVVTEHFMDPALLTVKILHDRGYVFVDHEFIGILSRMNKIYSIPVSVLPSQTISILVENQGRVTFDDELKDFKGILSNVTLDGRILTTWTMTSLPFNNTRMLSKLSRLAKSKSLRNTMAYTVSSVSSKGAPAIYTGEFVVNNTLVEPEDSFLYFDGWHKGIAFLNGFNLGRYWPIVGPQISLYAPKGVFLPYPQVNTVVVFELEKSPCFPETIHSKYNVKANDCYVEFRDAPFINSSTPLRRSKNFKTFGHSLTN